MSASGESWKVIIPCTRAEAERLHDDLPELVQFDPAPVILTQELVDFDDLAWEAQAYFDHKPLPAEIATLQSLFLSSKRKKPKIEAIGDEDWVTKSQAAIAPVEAGRFYVHTSSNAQALPTDKTCFRIDASRAFGTGAHETTAGCLEMLDRLRRRGMLFGNVADIGTGTGLLAFAAMHLWPRAYATASDIDPVSIDISTENAGLNDVPLGQSWGQLALCVASGTEHEMIHRRADYDLVIANILAGPLIDLAPALADIVRPGGTLVLAGLLNSQAEMVAKTYRAAGMRLAERRDNGDWPCLRFVKRTRFSYQRPVRARRQTTQPKGDFGEW
jgi:ribosomal protein L11 methyltransferase